MNEDFQALFADGVPALTPLTVKSDGPATAAPVASGVTGPWAACLRGEIVEGFNLVLYEGGVVDELEACRPPSRGAPRATSAPGSAPR